MITKPSTGPISIFISYAHEDELLLKKLKEHLSPLQRQGLIDIWHDRDISAGGEWEQEITKLLYTADIILLLVSQYFMASDYCYGVEVKQAIERHNRGEARVIPIILRPVYWQGAPFGKLQALPVDAKPITSWAKRDMAFLNVAEGIRKGVLTLLPRNIEEQQVYISEFGGAVPHRDTKTAKLVLQEKIATDTFDVFLCHNTNDKQEVKRIGEQLKERGILPWLDVWELRPGFPWQRLLEEQIEKIKSAAVFVGEDGIGPWQREEMEAFLREFVNRGCPVIPVLLKYAPSEPKLPLFLRGLTWVDFRQQEPNPFKQLIWGITGERDRFEAQKAELERQKILLEIEREQLEIEKQRVELQASRMGYALKTAHEMVDLLYPGLDNETKARAAQTIIPSLLPLFSDKGLELVTLAPQVEAKPADISERPTTKQ